MNANYPNSDIIVYQRPNNPAATPVVHRIVAEYTVNGTLYFQTKGDGNGVTWPNPINSSQYDSHNLWFTGDGVTQNLVLGRVVMRIPYFGRITLFMKDNSGAFPVVVGVIMLLVVVEFILPVVKAKNNKKPFGQQVQISKPI